MTWDGNDKVGQGKMTLTESQPNELVKINVDFVKPIEGSRASQFAFKPEGDQTAVTWSMSGHHNFIAKGDVPGVQRQEDDGRRHGQGARQHEDRG